MNQLQSLFIVLSLFLPQCVFAQSLRERLAGLTVGAHQGGLFTTHPNTIKRFEYARKRGVDIVELDLRLTADGEVVVFHDESMGLMTICTGKLRTYRWKELQECSLRFSKQRIPLFRDVLKWANGRVVINAEFKTLDVVEAAIDLVKEYQAFEWVFFQTKGDPERYYRARARSTEVQLLFAPGNEEGVDWALGLNDPNLPIIEIRKEIRDARIIRKIKAAGKLVLEDTFKYKWHQEILGATCREAFELGVDIAITNSPKGCVRQRDRFESRTHFLVDSAESPTDDAALDTHEVNPDEMVQAFQLEQNE